MNLTSTTMFAYGSGEGNSEQNYKFIEGNAFPINKIRYHDTSERTNLNSTLRATTSFSDDLKLDISGGFHAESYIERSTDWKLCRKWASRLQSKL